MDGDDGFLIIIISATRARPKTKVAFRQEPKVAEGEKRKINYQIEKNKGLTKRRRKECRNSRVKLKNKYSKAMKKLNGLRPGVKDRMNPVHYDGEASGINMNVVKSVSLKSS
jgi:U3 small nucleolar RNA-associated protein 3